MDVQTLWFQDETKSRTLIDAGSYHGTLIAIKRGDYFARKRRGRALPPSWARACLSFIFKTESGEEVAATVMANRDDAWPCMALIRSMAGAHQPTYTIIDDAEQFQNFLSGWIGQMFLLQIERSGCGWVNVVVSASPIPNDGGQE